MVGGLPLRETVEGFASPSLTLLLPSASLLG